MSFWLDDEAIQAWYESAPPPSRGRPQRYSDLAITTVLVIERVFRLTLRAAQGFIDSIFALMGVPLRSPDYSSVSKRAKLHCYLGLKAFTGRIQRNGVTHLLPMAMRTDKGILKAEELQDWLRENKVIIPTIDVV